MIKIKLALASSGALVLAACSISEPQTVIFRPNSQTFSDVKTAAQGVQDTFSKYGKGAREEAVLYDIVSLGAGVAGGFAAVYGSHTDLIVGLGLGSATANGWDAFANPTSIAGTYHEGITAITCAISLAEKLKKKGGEVASLALEHIPSDNLRFTKNGLDLHQLFAEYYIPFDMLRDLNALATSDLEAAELLKDGTISIIHSVNEAIVKRSSDPSKLAPDALIVAAKQFDEKVRTAAAATDKAGDQERFKASLASTLGPEQAGIVGFNVAEALERSDFFGGLATEISKKQVKPENIAACTSLVVIPSSS